MRTAIPIIGAPEGSAEVSTFSLPQPPPASPRCTGVMRWMYSSVGTTFSASWSWRHAPSSVGICRQSEADA